VSAGIKDRQFEQWVKNGTDQASKAGVNQTPTVKIDGKQVDVQTIDELVADVEKALSGN
jgi:protein-disulfide isomerase